jgi:hypothetical protein
MMAGDRHARRFLMITGSRQSVLLEMEGLVKG